MGGEDRVDDRRELVLVSERRPGKVVLRLDRAHRWALLAELVAPWGADCVLNYKTDDVPARIKDFTAGKGVNVWYETQRELDFEKMVDLMAVRGRMIVAAAVALAEAGIRLAGDWHLAALAPLYPAPPILALAIVGPLAKAIDVYAAPSRTPIVQRFP